MHNVTHTLVYDVVHYLAAGAVVALPAFGVGIGQGILNKMALKAVDQQPGASDGLKRILIISLTLSETAVLLGVVMSILLITQTGSAAYSNLGYLGVIFATALSGCAVGIISSWPAQGALAAVARQPFFVPRIAQLLLLTQSILQTPAIFGFIIGFLLRNQAPEATTLADGIRLLASGFAFGIGSLGPLIGLGLFTYAITKAVGYNRDMFSKLRMFTFISQALIEAPIVFALIAALLLALASSQAVPLLDSALYVAAALAIAGTTFSAGLSSGFTAASAARQMGEHPEQYPALSRMCILTQTLIDTSPIYGLLTFISLLYLAR